MSDKILLVTMPWATPVHPSIALGLLSSILRAAHIESVCLYGNMLLPGRPKDDSVYAIQDPGHYEDRSAGLSFVPYLYPRVTPEEIARQVAERHLGIVSREGHLDVKQWRLEDACLSIRQRLILQTMDDIHSAGQCLDRCMERIAAARYDLIGFSLTFETQLVSSLVLARRIKQRWPTIRIMFGGAACIGSQGVEMLKAFDCIDVVCLGEGDRLIVPLVAALRNFSSESLARLRGIAWRDGSRVYVNPSAEPMQDLDWLPVPAYESYFAQKRESDWAATPSVLLFESSRGCWWGQKHLCSFCGLNAETLKYRSKSAPRIFDEIRELCNRYEVRDGLQAVDNIFDTRYFRHLVPLLAEYQKSRPVALFFEIKSNVRLEQMYQLAAAGFCTVQPGIEAFNDHILSLMDKGANTVQQINFIKWAHQIGISPTYNILMRNPGENADDYREMTALLPFIEHLPPPNGIANMQLERYSPYFVRPENYGIRNVRPKNHYKLMFPDPKVNIAKLVYQFDYDHDTLDSEELVAARRDFLEAVLRWKGRFKPHRLVYYKGDNEVLILDHRSGRERTERLAGLAAELFLFLNEGRSFSAIEKRFPDVAVFVLRAFLTELVSKRYVYHHFRRDLYLAVVLRVYEDPETCRQEMEESLKEANLRASVLPTLETPALITIEKPLLTEVPNLDRAVSDKCTRSQRALDNAG